MNELPDERKDDPQSSFRLEISIAIGYHRKRTLLGGKWEGHAVTVVLLLGGVIVVIYVLTRLFQTLAST